MRGAFVTQFRDLLVRGFEAAQQRDA